MNVAQIATRHFEEHREQILADWFELLRYPTVGTDPARMGDCARCTAWLKRYLKRLGFETEVCLTRGQPVLLAERAGAAGAPTVLFYGHYDVQPADPIDLWKTPPFEPELRDGRVYARGAQDNKGQFFAFIQGMAALIATGAPLPTVRVVLEGEEESGSQALFDNLKTWRHRLASNVLLACDTSMHPCGRPAITAGLRGVASVTLELLGATHDLHSGVHGGLAPNPALGMARLLATLHDEQGRIAVAGFADDVVPPTAQELELAAAVPFDAEAYQQQTGVAPVGGASDTAPAVRVGFQPTIEVNGIHAGYGGEGTKTIIPARALAKLSLRLCPNQDARRCLDLLATHLCAHTPPGLRLELSQTHAVGSALRLPVRSPLVRLATDVLSELDPRGPVFLWDGASIPIVSELSVLTGAAPLLVGFGREDDCIHAPNESFSLAQFGMGVRYAALILSALAE